MAFGAEASRRDRAKSKIIVFVFSFLAAFYARAFNAETHGERVAYEFNFSFWPCRRRQEFSAFFQNQAVKNSNAVITFGAFCQKKGMASGFQTISEDISMFAAFCLKIFHLYAVNKDIVVVPVVLKNDACKRAAEICLY